MEQLGQDTIEYKQRQVSILSQESFYRELNADEAEKAQEGNFNFDHPGTCVASTCRCVCFDKV